jgi:putative ABC transport system permease protein
VKAIWVKAIADIRRRRLQSAVVLVIVLLASGTGTMALTLMSQTRDPYQRAFDAQKGAHLQVFYDRHTDYTLVAQTPQTLGATVHGGPYVSTSIAFYKGDTKYWLNTIGRDDPGGPVGILKVVAGHWPANDGEIALTRSFGDLRHFRVGDRIRVDSVPAKPVLTVSALVVDIDEGEAELSSQSAWVLSSAVTPLVKDLYWYAVGYRFAGDPTNAQLSGYLETLRAALPPGSIIGSINYLVVRNVFNITNSILTNLLLAFSAFALIAAVAIVANLVTGIVISTQREIGIMKSIGFTPAQVVAAFILQAIIPAATGALVGVPTGTLLSQPLLANSSHALGLVYDPTFSLPMDLLALAGAVAVVALAAALPALRAGLARPARVMTEAEAPAGSGGARIRRLATRLRLPRAVSFGAGEAFTRPLRGALTVLAVLIGVATILVSFSLPRSFDRIQASETGIGSYQVLVNRGTGFPDAAMMALLQAQPETERVVAMSGGAISVPGIAEPVHANLYRGDSSRLGYLLIRGRWFTQPGEVVAPMALLRDARLQVGDSFTGTAEGQQLQLRVVGEVYDIGNLGHGTFTDLATYPPARQDNTPSKYAVTLKPGSDATAYIKRIVAADPDNVGAQTNGQPTIGPVQIIDSVLLALGLVLVLIAMAAVFNTVLLNTRERIRDTATLKAIGMKPRQVLVMVASSAGLLAAFGAITGIPAGFVLARVLLDLVSTATGNDTPPSVYAGLGPIEVGVVPLAAILLAVLAALLPGRWAARTNVAQVLHSE